MVESTILLDLVESSMVSLAPWHLYRGVAEFETSIIVGRTSMNRFSNVYHKYIELTVSNIVSYIDILLYLS